MFRGMFVIVVHWSAKLYRVWGRRNMQNAPKYTVLLLCTSNVPNKFIPVHNPVPVRSSLSHNTHCISKFSRFLVQMLKATHGYGEVRCYA